MLVPCPMPRRLAPTPRTLIHSRRQSRRVCSLVYSPVSPVASSAPGSYCSLPLVFRYSDLLTIILIQLPDMYLCLLHVSPRPGVSAPPSSMSGGPCSRDSATSACLPGLISLLSGGPIWFHMRPAYCVRVLLLPVFFFSDLRSFASEPKPAGLLARSDGGRSTSEDTSFSARGARRCSSGSLRALGDLSGGLATRSAASSEDDAHPSGRSRVRRIPPGNTN